MKVRIFRAKAVNTLMTGVFYLIGGSFLLLIFFGPQISLWVLVFSALLSS